MHKVAFPKARALQPPNLPFDRYRASIPGRKAPLERFLVFNQTDFESVGINQLQDPLAETIIPAGYPDPIFFQP